MHQNHKSDQIKYYREQVDPEFEINRPRCYPRSVQFLLDFKINQVLRLANRPLSGLSVLVVCGGSGMDAEKLEQQGMCVTVTDLSLAAIMRAQERARRYGLSYKVQVADVEQLPFVDRSFDIVFVHDGLHHLPDPYIGVKEMARVARHAVIIAEPHDSAMARLAMKVGISGEWEDAGNFIYRLSGPDLTSFLGKHGFANAVWQTHMIFYPPWSIAVYKFLDKEAFFNPFKALFHSVDSLLGRYGNSLMLYAWRDGHKVQG